MRISIPKYAFWSLALVFGPAAAIAQDAPKPNVKYVRAHLTQTIDGTEMFHEYCAVCHGDQGKGNGPAAEALVKVPADLTQISRRNGGKFPKVKVMRVIEGADIPAAHGSRAMPIWGNIFRSLENQETSTLRVNALTEYIEKLQAQ
jgi:mono/diheme cytochrome c family protein